MIAPFLKEKFRWIESDTCWWCTKSRQTREHLFKECSAWRQEIRALWKEVGEATGDQDQGISTREEKGLDFFLRQEKELEAETQAIPRSAC